MELQFLVWINSNPNVGTIFGLVGLSTQIPLMFLLSRHPNPNLCTISQLQIWFGNMKVGTLGLVLFYHLILFNQDTYSDQFI